MNQRPVRMYATLFCPYCLRARMLLKRKGIQYEEISVGSDATLWAEMERLSQRDTVPQIFIGDLSIGGYDDMAALDRAGKLDALLFEP
ncbi:MAG: glutaredoxin 3 [Candidatus Thiothrix sulfatifontis]|uniref:Glutaredoxin n=1 Tax=Thiothrix subterranea TaxID=2735563 RepID=A0AA51MNR6_9GAMM|nr:glutaredoxin 3 [Thiothrix subterranea]MDQ5768588.1 glutaredoxin 3 [Thiothrix subterranea]QQZ29157.1 glutaredoxin 3 [Thiothrix subterranea]UOG92511.1 MAG: glutaredoxin 3 [Candidatus Thiothrix sulfatifontis]WML87528.1 glutaredoxin 3 [Thiothrix subterranea]